MLYNLQILTFYKPTGLHVQRTGEGDEGEGLRSERAWVIAQAFLLEHLVLEHLVPRNA